MQRISPIIFLFMSLTLKAQINIESIDSIVSHHIDQNHFEGTVLIADQGQIVYQHTYGLADREQKTAISDHTKFSIASITKMLTATVILQLVEAEQLSLEDNLKTLLPEVEVPKANKITVHDLLLHISGLPNEPKEAYLKPNSPKEMIEKALDSKNKGFKYGKFNYNNVDYFLLGLIIEKITGKSWSVVIEERIIRKLGLSATGFLRKSNYPESFAYTYQINKMERFVKDPAFHIENFYAAGCMYATAKDLLLIDQAMYGELLLSDSMREKMFTSYPEYNYAGYAVWTYTYPFAATKPKVMERRGGIMGANVVLMRLLDRNQTIIILSNNDAFNPDSFGDYNNLREALLREIAK